MAIYDGVVLSSKLRQVSKFKLMGGGVDVLDIVRRAIDNSSWYSIFYEYITVYSYIVSISIIV